MIADALHQLYELIHPGTHAKIAEACINDSGNPLHVSNVPLGILYFSMGWTYELLYSLCMVVMLRPKFFKMTCYKILFAMGVVDMISLIPNSIFAGFYLIVGGSVCTHPLSMIWGGHIAYAMWCAYCLFGIILGVNRCFDFLAQPLSEKIFSAWKLKLIIAMPYVWFLYVLLFDYGTYFHPFLAGYFFDINPFKTISIRPIHIVNNLGVTVIVLVLNCIMLWSMISMARQTSQRVTPMQRAIVIQCLAICLTMIVASAIYSFMQFCKFPMIFTVISTMMWQFSNGSNAIFYICVNRTMRSEIFDLLGSTFGLPLPRKSSQGISLLSKHSSTTMDHKTSRSNKEKESDPKIERLADSSEI